MVEDDFRPPPGPVAQFQVSRIGYIRRGAGGINDQGPSVFWFCRFLGFSRFGAAATGMAAFVFFVIIG